MAEMTWLQRQGLTPVKATVIVVLSIVLVAVICYQFAGDDGPQHTANRSEGARAHRQSASRASVAPKANAPVRGRTAAADRQNGRTGSPDDRRPGPAWPTLSLADVLANNPLTRPTRLTARIEAVRASRVAENRPEETEDGPSESDREQKRLEVQRRREAVLTRLIADGVEVMIRGRHGKTALIGSKWTHVGDVIEGFIIRDIRPDGVVLGEPEAPAAERTR